MFLKFLNDKSGATAIEYGLIAALIALAALAGISTTGSNLGGIWTHTGEEVKSVIKKP